MAITQLGGNRGQGVTGQTLAGKALADDGEVYDTVQAAVDNASGLVMVGPGTFNEAVNISTAGLRLVGSGYGTLIDGGTDGSAILVSADNVKVENLRVQTTVAAGNPYHGVEQAAGDNVSIQNVVVSGADGHGIDCESTSTGVSILDCFVSNTDDRGVTGVGNQGIVSGCIIKSCLRGIAPYGDDALVVNNIIFDSNQHGIYAGGSVDGLIGGNRIHNSGIYGIRVDTTFDIIIFNNRISNSTSGDIQDDGTGTLLDSNVTGAA